MAQLLQFTRLSFTRYLMLLLITCFFLSISAHSSARPPDKQQKTYSVSLIQTVHAIIDMQVFLAPEHLKISSPVIWTVYKHPINDMKPNNILFQPIRMRSLGFLSRQINV